MYNSILNKIKEKVQSIPVPTITPTPQKIEPVLKGTLLPEALPGIQESNRAYSDMYNSILNKIKSIPLPTITPTPQKIKPVLKGTLLPEALPRIQESNRAYSDMLDTKLDYPSAQKTAQGIYKSIKKQFTPREEAVPVRRAFEKEPVMTKAPPIVTSLGQLGFSILEAIPRAVATFYGEVSAPERKTGEVDIGINAKRLGYENEKYTTAAKEFKDKVEAGENPWIAGLNVVSNKTLDVAFGAQLLSSISRFITRKLTSGAIDRKLAKETVDAFKKNQKQLFESTKNLPLLEREKALADLTNARDVAERVLIEEGLPTTLDKARIEASKYTDVLGRETSIGGGFWSRFAQPDMNIKPTELAPSPIAGLLPGERPKPGQAPGVGLSLREMESVGGIGGKPQINEYPIEDVIFQEAKKYKSAEGFVKAQGKNNPLLETAKDFENADDFISFYRGSSTQYGKYMPEIRKFGTTEESIRVPELGVDPEKKITIYRGIDTIEGGKMRGFINDGDFVTTDFDSANAYTGGKVVSKEVKAKDLILDYPEKSDFENPFYKGAEFIYSDSKNTLIKRSDADLRKIFDEAKSYQIKIPITEWEKQAAYIQKNGKIPPNADLKGYSKSPEYNKYGTTERQRASAYYEYVSNKIDESIKTKSQLEDIWNKSNKNVDIKPPHLKFDSTGRPLAYTAREEAILQKAQELPITPETKSLAQIAEQEGFSIPKELQTPKEIKLSENVYETNRSLGGGKETVKDKIKKYGESIGGGADKIIGVISTRLKNLNPVLKREMRDYEYKLATNTEKDFEKVVPFMKSFKKLSDADFADLDLALKNSDVAKTNQIIKKNGLEKEFAEIRTTLDSLYNRAKEVGFDTPYRGNYFPRQVRDSTKFMDYLEKTNEWNKIDEIIKKKEEELQRYLTNEEKAVLADFSINTGEKKGIEVGAMKERTIEIIDGELNKFYVDSNTALNNYIQSVNEAIESWKFFTKGLKVKIDKYTKLDDTIDAYVFQKVANGVISPAQAKELTNILKSRFADIGTRGIVTLYKNLSYIDTMGSPISAITQIGDLGFSLYRAGLYRTLKHTLKALVGRSNIKRADIGIDKIAQEFADPGAAAKLLSQVFKSVGLTNIDAIGKETLYNAIIDKYREQALKPTPDFMRRMEEVFGNETSQIIADLKSGQNTENVKMLAFNELLDVQPIKLSEMPEAYLKGGNGRIFYMLKTYTIKLFDVYRNEVFQEMKRNKARGIYNLIKLTSALVLANATADEIKDFILGRETSLKDRTIDNLLRLVGFSKFGIYKARQEGLPSAFLQSILPPAKFLNNLYKDIVNPPEEAKDLRTIQSIPLVGKLYYWWFGRGAEPKSDFPEMPDLPELPDMPKPPKLPKLPKL